MTSNSIPSNPFAGEQGIRIEKAVRLAIGSGHMLTVGDVLVALRMDPGLSNDDFGQFFKAMLEARRRFEVERWVASIINGEV
jgi:hypothetical protein